MSVVFFTLGENTHAFSCVVEDSLLHCIRCEYLNGLCLSKRLGE